MSVPSGPSDDIIQVDELNAIGIHEVLELCSCDMQLEHSHIVLALCHDLKVVDYAQNYAGIIFSGRLLIVVRLHYLHQNSGMETIHTGVASVNHATWPCRRDAEWYF